MDANLFDKAARFVRDIQDFDELTGVDLKLGNEELLKLYALYRQSTLGPCTGPRPSFFDIQGRHKYDAWKELGELSRVQAMQNYVELVVEYAMNLQASLLDLQRAVKNDYDSGRVRLLQSRISELKDGCAILWPQRYAHLRVPGVEEIAESNYEKEEEASYGQRDDNSFGSPLVLSDELRIPIPGTISSFLTGNGVTTSGVPFRPPRPGTACSGGDENDIGGEEDPLHVKEPPPAADISTDSLNRGPPSISKDVYELFSLLLRRVEILEDANRAAQQRLESIQRRHGRILHTLIFTLKLVGGGSVIILLLYFVLKLFKPRVNGLIGH